MNNSLVFHYSCCCWGKWEKGKTRKIQMKCKMSFSFMFIPFTISSSTSQARPSILILSGTTLDKMPPNEGLAGRATESPCSLLEQLMMAWWSRIYPTACIESTIEAVNKFIMRIMLIFSSFSLFALYPHSNFFFFFLFHIMKVSIYI